MEPNLSTSIFKKGYTLIEILVVMSVISIIFGVGYSNFRSFARRQSLASFIKKMKGDLVLTREKAISGEKPDDSRCNSPNTLEGYNFRVEPGVEYRIRATCSSGSPIIKREIIPENIDIVSNGSNDVLFKVLSQGTDLDSDVRFTITEESSLHSASIEILKSGEIK